MDFLTFKRFISIEVLIAFYYVGALIMPISLWFFLTWLIRHYNVLHMAYEGGKDRIWNLLSGKQKLKIVAFFTMSFLFLELLWRMLFEFLIAYLQMRDALLQIQP